MLAVILMTCAVGTETSAQNYAIDWYKVGGGGNTSAGGGYTLSGTVGQPDAGMLGGANYAVAGGFWGIIQTPGTPRLRIGRDITTGGLVIWWGASASGFLLEQRSGLESATGVAWTETQRPYQTNAGKVFITEPTPLGNRFYRLRQP